MGVNCVSTHLVILSPCVVLMLGAQLPRVDFLKHGSEPKGGAQL